MIVIELRNPRNNRYFRAMDQETFIKEHGVYATDIKNEQIINETEYDYMLYPHTITGIGTLPSQNNQFVGGFQQDAEDYQYSEYENRQITFQMRQYSGRGATHRASVFYQITEKGNNNLLDVKITTDFGTYNTKATVEGSTEGGVVDLICPSPYHLFTTDRVTKGQYTILANPDGIPLIPFRLPRKFFTASEEQGTVVINALFATFFVLELKGTFEDIDIYCYATNDIIKYRGTVQETMIIDTENATAVVDGVDVTDQVTGLYPDLLEGENKFEVKFGEGTQRTDVVFTITYDEVVANVEY